MSWMPLVMNFTRWRKSTSEVRTTPHFIEIKREKEPWRVLGPAEMRNVEKVRKRLLRLLKESTS